MFKGYCETVVMIFRDSNFLQYSGQTFSSMGLSKDSVWKDLVSQIKEAQKTDRFIYPVNVQILEYV